MSYGVFKMNPQQQNEILLYQEFYGTFIEKIINAFDINGEINSYWQIIRQKIKEEKSVQSLFKFITTFEIKKMKSNKHQNQQQQEEEDEFKSSELLDHNKSLEKLISIPSLLTTATNTTQTSQTKEDDQFFISKRTPTNIKTVSIQFDVLGKNNSNNSDNFSQDIPSLFQTPLQRTLPPPLLITKNFSAMQLKNGLDSPQSSKNNNNSSNNSFQQSNSTGYYSSTMSKNPKRMIENFKKRTTTTLVSPLSAVSKPSSLKIIRHHSESTDNQSKSPSIKDMNDIKELYNTKNTQNHQIINSNQNKINNIINQNVNEDNEKKPKLKRFSPQQIMRMGSIREADDETKEDKEQNINKEIVDKLLCLIQSSTNSFKRDSETLNIIHGKSTLANIDNCKNSIGIEFIKNSHSNDNNINNIKSIELQKFNSLNSQTPSKFITGNHQISLNQNNNNNNNLINNYNHHISNNYLHHHSNHHHHHNSFNSHQHSTSQPILNNHHNNSNGNYLKQHAK